MKIFDLTRRNIQLLAEIKKKGGTVTQREQSVYSAFSFYINIKGLIKRGLITDNGLVSDDSNAKSWSITKNGEQLLYHIDEVDKLWQ